MDIFDVTRYVGALLATLALMGGAFVLARRFLPNLATPLRPAERRLQLVESLNLDPRRRLVLVRCDEREHLLLLGAAGEQVVDAAPATSSAAAQGASGAETSP